MSTTTVPGATPYDMPLPIIWPDDSARTRTTDPLTSHAGADVSAASVESSHELVIRILEDAAIPLTQEAIVARAKSWPYASRLDHGVVGRTSRDNKAQLWTLAGEQ